ncbi:hypothetical protein CASFOL_017276 [Castilleja foliolosa]|uniref:Glucose-6-phosphate 1-epimerase n=1 Tax=Castilleja foliolosa TaxID=1961234 RepID=A0ABD3DE61_9LAMI
MDLYMMTVVLFWSLLFTGVFSAKDVNIGAIMTFGSINGRVAKFAMNAAVEDVNSDPSFLHGKKLVLSRHDSNYSGFLGIIGDRVYLSSPQCVAVLDHEKKRTYVMRKEGLPDIVVWNPWEKKSKAMSDFGDEEYKQMATILDVFVCWFVLNRGCMK